MKEKIKEYFPFVTWAMVGGLIWMLAKQEDKQFTTVKKKVQTEDHIEKTPGEEYFYENLRRLDTISKVVLGDAKENLDRDQVRDSIVKVQDTLVKRNTITIYQMKQTQDTILKKLDKYIKIHDQ